MEVQRQRVGFNFWMFGEFEVVKSDGNIPILVGIFSPDLGTMQIRTTNLHCFGAI